MGTGLDSNPRPPEMLMPVSDEHALRQFEIEALRQINRNLEKLFEQQASQSDSLHSIDVRLTRIESNSVSAKVEELEKKVDTLESDKDQRVGAVNLATWLFRNWPGVIAFFVAVVTFLKVMGKI